ncbi:MAG: RNA-binding domain-containing protein [Candidatus Saliniplasma sp.]
MRPMEMYPEQIEFKVKIRTPVYPTENPDKIIDCLNKIFPEAIWEINEKEITGESTSLETFAEIIENMRIRDTVRSYIKDRIIGDRCSFTLSKQASCNRKVNLSDEDQPLGGIHVTIESEDIDTLINKITET